MSDRPPIRLFDLAAQHAPIRREMDAAIARVIDSGRFVLGEEVERFEREFAQYCGAREAVSCGSGSDALLLALMAHEIGPGDEVLCPGYSFFASASCIARLGARPVFVDIRCADYGIDPDCLRRTLLECRRPRALIGVDLFGRLCDLDALLEIGREFDLPVVEDAAQAVGACDATCARAGSRAHVACFSFYPTKNLGCLGDGGMITTNEAQLAERLRLLRSHGTHANYRHERVGVNSRLDALQAAVLRVKLRHLENWTQARNAHACLYDAVLSDAGAASSDRFDEDPTRRLAIPQPAPPPARHVYHHYVIRVRNDRRDALRAHLLEDAIDSAVYYPLGLHQQTCFEGPAGIPALPRCEAASRETLAIPVHPTLAGDELERVAARVADFA